MKSGELSKALCSITRQELASRIDHAVLKPGATREELEKAVNELEKLSLRCLITTPTYLPLARDMTKRCVGAVAGFPFGYHTVEAKIKEVEDLIALGADEIDYVANTQLFLLGREKEYFNEIRAVTTICRNAGVKCKIIIETPILNPENIVRIVGNIAEMDPQPDYIKTSTGYGPRPTYPEDVYIINRTLEARNARSKIGIKAAGGIREALQAILFILLGADIIGTSTPEKILSSYNTYCK